MNSVVQQSRPVADSDLEEAVVLGMNQKSEQTESHQLEEVVGQSLGQICSSNKRHHAHICSTIDVGRGPLPRPLPPQLALPPLPLFMRPPPLL